MLAFEVEIGHLFAHPLSTLEPLFMRDIDHAFQLVLPTEPGNQLITEIEGSALVAPSYLAPSVRNINHALQLVLIAEPGPFEAFKIEHRASDTTPLMLTLVSEV
mmetsp:Transcript_2022/g.3069  ORF Transcript_2022/g.3069 Transcript_2022/m.3069 type:complete len:104 (-) Transcript_2022:880-1191(-)